MLFSSVGVSFALVACCFGVLLVLLLGLSLGCLCVMVSCVLVY